MSYYENFSQGKQEIPYSREIHSQKTNTCKHKICWFLHVAKVMYQKTYINRHSIFVSQNTICSLLHKSTCNLIISKKVPPRKRLIKVIQKQWIATIYDDLIISMLSNYVKFSTAILRALRIQTRINTIISLLARFIMLIWKTKVTNESMYNLAKR